MIRFGYLSDRIESAMEEQDFDGALKLQDALLELQQGRGRRVHQLLNPFHGRGVWREQSHCIYTILCCTYRPAESRRRLS